MKNMFKIIGVVSLLLVFLTGCRTSSVYNVQNSPVMSTKKLTEQEMYKAIYAAGATLGWNVTKIEPGKAQAQLNLRNHMAQVLITYNKKDFSINYKNSLNIKYNSEKGTIHSNYNGWVQNLQKAINTQIKLLNM